MSFIDDHHHWRVFSQLHIIPSVRLGCDWCVSIDCNQLQSFTITSNKLGSFCHVKEFSLKSHSFWHLWLTDLPSLEHISIGPNCFVNVKTAVFESAICCLQWWIDLASLKSIELGAKVFQGDSAQSSLKYYPFKFDSSLVMKSSEWNENNNQICLSLKRWLLEWIAYCYWITLSWRVDQEHTSDE